MNLILIFCGTVVVLVMALMTLIVVRSLYQMFYEEGGMFYSFLYATTEPVIHRYGQFCRAQSCSTLCLSIYQVSSHGYFSCSCG